MALHFGCCPQHLDTGQVEEYLYRCKKQHNSPSESFFKHTVYGLRYVYKLLGIKDKHVSLPRIERPKKLPVVMNAREVKQMLKAPALLKHRLILGMLYGCGLRSFELCNIKLSDVDLERKMLHIRQGKGRKDRYVVLSAMLVRGLNKYIMAEQPINYLFNGQPDVDGKPTPYSSRGIQWIIRASRRKTGIEKQITAHSFRHSYATHLLEQGMDIITLKDCLGHSFIETTLVYLHVARVGRTRAFSPLEKLYSKT